MILARLWTGNRTLWAVARSPCVKRPAILGKVDAKAMLLEYLSMNWRTKMKATHCQAGSRRSQPCGLVTDQSIRDRWMRRRGMNVRRPALREMEATPHSVPCTPCRPIYVDAEKLKRI